MRLALIVEYEGTNYKGFQFQTNGPSIQEELEKAIASLTGEKVRVNGAGRTDAGVHAKGQVVAFDTSSEHSPDTVVRALNHYLPDDIAVKSARTVKDNFDPRRQALSRKYRYTILNSATPSPLKRKTACHISVPLDICKMREAASVFIGEHNFEKFAAPLEMEDASAIRYIFRASVDKIENLITFDVEGSSFLRHQVRRMAGALADVGRHKLSINDLKAMIEGEDTDAVAHSLAPQGLCLMEVVYANFPAKVGESDDDEY